MHPPHSRALLLLRSYVGAAVLFAHGLPKLQELTSGDQHFVELVASLGLPVPVLFAWLAALAQCIGSTALVLGVATRLAATLVASTIVIGVIGAHLHDPFRVVEAGVAYIVMLIALALLGPGELALERLLRRPREPVNKRIQVAITRRVRAGREHDFEQALRQFFRDALEEPTTSGAALILPLPNSGSNEYGVLRSFPDVRAKDAFYHSETFQHWERKVAPLVEGEATKRELHGLEAFFRTDEPAQPPAWKMAVLTWIAVNPAVWVWSQVAPRFLGDGAPALVQLLVVNVFVVATLTWLFMPALVHTLRTWLR